MKSICPFTCGLKTTYLQQNRHSSLPIPPTPFLIQTKSFRTLPIYSYHFFLPMVIMMMDIIVCPLTAAPNAVCCPSPADRSRFVSVVQQSPLNYRNGRFVAEKRNLGCCVWCRCTPVVIPSRCQVKGLKMARISSQIDRYRSFRLISYFHRKWIRKQQHRHLPATLA